MDLIKIAEEAFATGKQHPSFIGVLSSVGRCHNGFRQEHQ